MSEAAAKTRRELCADPSGGGALYLHGVEAFQRAEIEGAMTWWRRVLTCAPEMLAPRIDLAACLINGGHGGAAWRVLAPAIVLQANLVECWGNLGALLLLMRRPIDAARAFARANACRPDDMTSLAGLAAAALRSGLIALSLRSSRRAAAGAPALTAAWYNLALALDANGGFPAAERAIGRACTIAPSDAEARFARALALLRRGEFTRGFREYEWRQRIPRFAMPSAPRSARPWEGERDPNATLLVRCEQGAGDTIQFARLLKLARERVGRLIVVCEPDLAPLIATAAGVDAVVGSNDESATYWVPLLSLPRILGLTLSGLPAEIPYLAVDPALRDRWSRRLAGGSGLRVGIAWQGNPEQANEPGRSPPLPAMLPILSVGGARFYSLQVGRGRGQLKEVPSSLRIEDLGAEITSFADTAAAMHALDLVISPCTAITHLAGALGRPVWVMLMRGADWRWFERGTTSPWYPTARLFRQDTAGDWNGVVARIADELRSQVARKADPAKPVAVG